MKDLYERLAKVGFDAAFVRDHILPDWWDDSLGEVPANRALAEGCISRVLGWHVRELRDAGTSLRITSVEDVRLKKRTGTKPRDIAPAILLAQNAAKIVADSLVPLAPYGGGMSAQAIREEILRTRQFVDLDALVEFSWAHGVPVVHLLDLPRPSRRFSGLAMFAGATPVIVLASGHDSAPWLAFHLAHELGHLFEGHVAPGKPAIAETDIDQVDDDEEERQADTFACVLLTDHPGPQLTAEFGLTAERLVSRVCALGQQHRIDPGVIALVYGRSAQRMPVAQLALKQMGLDRGAHERISERLQKHLQEEMPEWVSRFLSLMTLA